MNIYEILSVVRDSIYGGIGCITLIYSCLIIFLRRYHNRNRMFILNLCINAIFTCIYFIIFSNFAGSVISSIACIFLQYAFNVASVQVPYAFLAFSLHRFCSIVYHTRPLFKTKKWVFLCISSQWIGQFIISLPLVFQSYEVSPFFVFI